MEVDQSILLFCCRVAHIQITVSRIMMPPVVVTSLMQGLDMGYKTLFGKDEDKFI
jgi:hypothetical protein